MDRRVALEIQNKKCVFMHYGHNNKRVPLYIDVEQLAESENESDLGVIFTTNLK